MKIFGVLLIVIGLLSMAAPAITKLWERDKGVPGILTAMELKDAKGNEVSLYPLLGIVSFATGAAMITAAFITKKR